MLYKDFDFPIMSRLCGIVTPARTTHRVVPNATQVGNRLSQPFGSFILCNLWYGVNNLCMWSGARAIEGKKINPASKPSVKAKPTVKALIGHMRPAASNRPHLVRVSGWCHLAGRLHKPDSVETM